MMDVFRTYLSVRRAAVALAAALALAALAAGCGAQSAAPEQPEEPAAQIDAPAAHEEMTAAAAPVEMGGDAASSTPEDVVG